MKTSKNLFVCQNCGKSYSKWQGRCEGCGEWNSLAEEIVSLEKGRASQVNTGQLMDKFVVSISQVSQLKGSFERFSLGIEELDRCLGTDERGKQGMVTGSVVLLGGQPGIGKSTLLTQVVIAWQKTKMSEINSRKKRGESNNEQKGQKIADTKGRESVNDMGDEGKMTDLPLVLYVCGEESPGQINLRLERLSNNCELAGNMNLEYVTTTVLEEIMAIIAEKRPGLLIVDSVQTVKSGELSGPAGSLGQVKMVSESLTRLAKEHNIPTFLVGHVTKEGELAGPKVLEHVVDGIFELTGERGGDLRFLRTLKNRFGANDEIGVFQMKEGGMSEVKNPSAYFLQDAQTMVPGSGVVCLMEGTRPLLTEVQALVVTTQLAMPRRVGRGVDLSRVQVLAAILQKHCGLPLGMNDIFLSVVGGMQIKETGIDLGLAMAIISSLKDKALPAKAVFIGELGLMGEIRAVSAYERRVKEVKRLGYEEIYSHKSHKNIKDLLKDWRW